MKKIVRKCTSVVLAMVIVLCSLSVVAFAEEVEPTAACTHSHVSVSVGAQRCVATNGSVHTWYDTEIRTCMDCGYQYTVLAGAIRDENHSWRDSSSTVKICSKCGYTVDP